MDVPVDHTLRDLDSASETQAGDGYAVTLRLDGRCKRAKYTHYTDAWKHASFSEGGQGACSAGRLQGGQSWRDRGKTHSGVTVGARVVTAAGREGMRQSQEC